MPRGERQRRAFDRRVGPEARPRKEARPDRTSETRHLQWRHEQLPLSDGRMREVARVPRQVVAAALVFGRRDDTCGILRKVDPRLRAEPHRARSGEKRIRADVAAEAGEIRVAALLERVPHVYRPMPPAAPAMEPHRAEFEHAGALVAGPGRNSGGKFRERRHRLESGSRRVRLEAGAVAVVVTRVPEKPLVHFGREMRHEDVQVVCGSARECKHRAVARIEDCARAAHATKLPLDRALHGDVHGKPEVRPPPRLDDDRLLDGEAARVHSDLQFSRRAAQIAVVERLEALSPAHLLVAEVELLPGRRLRLAAADVAEDVRGEPALRVDALLGLDTREARKLRRMLGKARYRLVADIPPHEKRARKPLAHVARYRVRRERRRDSDCRRHLVHGVGNCKHGVAPRAALEALGVHRDGNGRPVVGKDGPVASDNAPARARRQHAAYRLPCAVVGMLRGFRELHLREAEAERDKARDEHDADAKHGEVAHDGRVVTHRRPPFSRATTARQAK